MRQEKNPNVGRNREAESEWERKINDAHQHAKDQQDRAKADPRYAFGEWIRRYRADNQITLRDFCKSRNVDSGNWSKLERGVMAPPPDIVQQRRIVREIIGIDESHPDYYWVFAMMKDARASILRQVGESHNVVGALPMFVSKADGTRLTHSELQDLIEFVKDHDRPTEYEDVSK